MTLRASAVLVVLALMFAVAVVRCGPGDAPTPPPATGRSFALAYTEPSTYLDGRPLTNLSHTRAVCQSLGPDHERYEVVVEASSPAGGAEVEARFVIDPFPFPGIECWATAHTPYAQSVESSHIFWDGAS